MSAKVSKTGLSRPGASMIAGGFLVSTILSILRAVLGPTGYTTSLGFAVIVGLIAGWIVLMIGSIKYSRNKGYSGWVGFWLSLGVPSLIGLLILPDRSSERGAL